MPAENAPASSGGNPFLHPSLPPPRASQAHDTYVWKPQKEEASTLKKGAPAECFCRKSLILGEKFLPFRLCPGSIAITNPRTPPLICPSRRSHHHVSTIPYISETSPKSFVRSFVFSLTSCDSLSVENHFAKEQKEEAKGEKPAANAGTHVRPCAQAWRQAPSIRTGVERMVKLEPAPRRVGVVTSGERPSHNRVAKSPVHQEAAEANSELSVGGDESGRARASGQDKQHRKTTTAI